MEETPYCNMLESPGLFFFFWLVGWFLMVVVVLFVVFLFKAEHRDIFN